MSQQIKNILFFSIEDLNDWVEPLSGHRDAHTPNLSALAAKGALFKNAYAAAPACCPSRTSLLFSRFPWNSGIMLNTQPLYDYFRKGQRDSLIGRMRNNGFRTIGSGKIFHKIMPKAVDLNDWDDYHYEKKDVYQPISRSVKSGDFKPGENFGVDQTDLPTADDKNIDHITKNISKGDEGQLWAAGTRRPHLPFVVRQEFFDKIPEQVSLPPGLLGDFFDPTDKSALSRIPRLGQRFAAARATDGVKLIRHGEYIDFIRAYLASITYADHLFGRVYQRLEQQDLLKNTLIVVLSDHGWQLGEKLAFRKYTLWERALRVPLIISGPGIQPKEVTDPVSLVDIAPTIMSLTGLDVPEAFEGQDLKQVLLENAKPQRSFAPSVWGIHLNSKKPKFAFSIRTKKFRITKYRNRRYELYNHANDPFEHKNRARKLRSGKFSGLKDQIDEFSAAAASKLSTHFNP